MKKLTAVLCFSFLTLPVYSLTFLEYLAHCNLSMGVNFMAGGEIAGDGETHTIKLKSNSGNEHFFYYNSSQFSNSPAGASANCRLPFYFNDAIAVGFNFDVGGLDIMTFSPGLYLDWYLFQYFSLVAGIGPSITYLSQTIAQSGRKDVAVSGFGMGIIGASIGAKFHVFKYLYAEAGYRFAWNRKVDAFSIMFDGETLGDYDLPSVDVSPSHNFSIKIGIGI